VVYGGDLEGGAHADAGVLAPAPLYPSGESRP
jgi:hypothetical protein